MKTQTSPTTAAAPAPLHGAVPDESLLSGLLAAIAAHPESAAALRALLLALADALRPALHPATDAGSTPVAPGPGCGAMATGVTRKRPKAKSAATPPIGERRARFVEEVGLTAPACGMDRREAERFAGYWTESNPGGRKMRFEMQRVFDMRRRMACWMERSRRMSLRTAGGHARPLDATDLPEADDLLET